MFNIYWFILFYNDIYTNYHLYSLKHRRNLTKIRSLIKRYVFYLTVYSAFTYMNLRYKYPATLWTCVFLGLDLWYFITGTEDFFFEIHFFFSCVWKKTREQWRTFFNTKLLRLIHPATIEYYEIEDIVEFFHFAMASYFYMFLVLIFLDFYECLFRFSDYILPEGGNFKEIVFSSVSFSLIFTFIDLAFMDFILFIFGLTSWQWFVD